MNDAEVLQKKKLLLTLLQHILESYARICVVWL